MADMVKPKIYLDTTVPSAYLDERTPERKKLTVDFWTNQLPRYDPVISDLLLDEVGDTSDPAKRQKILQLISGFKVVDLTETAVALARIYMQAGIFPPGALADARHAAIAVANQIGYLISWNYRHLVKIKTRTQVNAVNAKHGWEPIEIITPPEL